MNITKHKESVTTSFAYNGETVNIRVRRPTFREASTKEFSEKFNKIKDDVSLTADLIAEYVEWWDVTDGPNDEPIALERESLLDLPADFLTELAEAMAGVLTPEKKPQTPASLDAG